MAHGARTRASTNRLGYTWRNRRQLDPGCGMDLLAAVGRFLCQVHGEPVATLLAVSAGAESSEPSLEQTLRAVEGLVQDHETAILQLERTDVRLAILPVLNECVEVTFTEEISQHVDAPAPQVSKEHFKVERLVPHECASENKCCPQIFVDAPVHQNFEEFAEVADFVLPECAFENRFSPQILFGVPVPQILGQFSDDFFNKMMMCLFHRMPSTHQLL